MANAPNVATGTGQIPAAPTKPKTKPKTAAKPKAHAPASKGRYQWGTGGKVHSISQAAHDQRVQTQRTLGTQDLTAPPTGAQAITEANSAADLQFGPQIQAAQQLQTNIAPWFQDYLARVAGYAQTAQKLSQPALDQAQSYQANAATQTPAGLDPNSDAGKQAAQAAQGRQALAQLGLDALKGNAQASQDYFGAQQSNAARELPQAQTAAAQQVASAQSQRGNAVNTYLTTARQNAQNYAIARGTLDLNDTKATNDATLNAAKITQTAADKRAARVVTKRGQDITKSTAADRSAAAAATPNQYGVPAGQWDHWSTSHRQRYIDAFNAKKGQGATEKDASKHAADIQKASGTVENQVADIQSAWGRGGTMPAPTAKDKNATRPMTAAELRQALGAKYGGTMVGIMERVRAKQPLTPQQIDYLHNLGTNVRIPHEWLHPPVQPKAKLPPKPGSSLTNPLTGQPNPIVPGG